MIINMKTKTTLFHRIVDLLLGTQSVIIISEPVIVKEKVNPKYKYLIDWTLDGREWMDTIEISPHMKEEEIEEDIKNQLKKKFNIADNRVVEIVEWTNLETLDHQRITIQEEDS